MLTSRNADEILWSSPDDNIVYVTRQGRGLYTLEFHERNFYEWRYEISQFSEIMEPQSFVAFLDSMEYNICMGYRFEKPVLVHWCDGVLRITERKND